MNSVNNISSCASCGQGGPLKYCTNCRMVRYCSKACQKANWGTHKNSCLKRSASLYSEREANLFKTVDNLVCCICAVPMPQNVVAIMWIPCCGRLYCSGCFYHHNASAAVAGSVCTCPFCRAPHTSSSEEGKQMVLKRAQTGDEYAYLTLGTACSRGSLGFTQNMQMAFKYWEKASKLGCAEGLANIAICLERGEGVEQDVKKSLRYWEEAAMAGSNQARARLGVISVTEREFRRAYRHLCVSAASGHQESMRLLGNMLDIGAISREEHYEIREKYEQARKSLMTKSRIVSAEIRLNRLNEDENISIVSVVEW